MANPLINSVDAVLVVYSLRETVVAGVRAEFEARE